MENSGFKMQLMAGIAATISTVVVGFTVGWSAPSLPKLLSDDSEVPITSSQSSWIVSATSFGVIFGSPMGAALVDKYGRKITLLNTIIPYVISFVLIGIAQSYWWFIIARFIAGFTSGIALTVIPMYLGEIAADRIRGILGVMPSVTMDIGILMAYCVGPWVSRPVLAALGASVPIAFGAMFIWVPESPYYFIMKNKPGHAQKSLQWLRAKESVDEEFMGLKENVEFDLKNAGTVKDLVMVPGNRKALFIVVALMTAQQLSGIGAILSYSSLIFEASGSVLDSSISVIIVGVVQLLSGLLATFTVDWTGRRPLLMLSFIGTILCLGGEALYFQLQATKNDVSMISWLPVTAIIGYMVLYSIGLGALPYLIVSEIFPYNVKASASMAVNITSGSVGLIVTKLYQVIADEYGIHVSFWVFAIITVFFAIVFYFILPETKQRSLLSIQKELHSSKVNDPEKLINSQGH